MREGDLDIWLKLPDFWVESLSFERSFSSHNNMHFDFAFEDSGRPPKIPALNPSWSRFRVIPAMISRNFKSTAEKCRKRVNEVFLFHPVLSLWILAHRTSEDEQGVYNHLRNAMYLGSMKPFSEGDWIPRRRF